jgi:WD40 repeat protein
MGRNGNEEGSLSYQSASILLLKLYQENYLPALWVFLPILHAQETYFQTGNTHDILEVHFSPDDEQLVSSSAADQRLILWNVQSGHQIWSRDTGFIRRSNEGINLKEFYGSEDGKSLATRSMNGTYQTRDAQTGKAIYLGFTFQKENPDGNSPFENDYGTVQKLYLHETDLPK